MHWFVCLSKTDIKPSSDLIMAGDTSAETPVAEHSETPTRASTATVVKQTGSVTEIVNKSNKKMAAAVLKMKALLVESCTDKTKIMVARERVKQAKLKAERDYLRSLLGEPDIADQYSDKVASRISAMLNKAIIPGDVEGIEASPVDEYVLVDSMPPKTVQKPPRPVIESPESEKDDEEDKGLTAEQQEQVERLAQLQKLEDDLKEKSEKEAQQKREKEEKLARAKAQFEAKKAAAEDERKRQEAIVVEAKKREQEIKMKQQATLEVQKEERMVKAATQDDDLSEWHGKNKGILANADKQKDHDAMLAIEEAQRQAIQEMEFGSAATNDDAILRAMAKTNPNAYQERITEKQAISPSPQFAEDQKQLEEKQRIREQYGIPTAGTLLRKSKSVKKTKTSLGDADYLLSMITSGVDEDTEATDDDGARYHITTDGEKIYRASDVDNDDDSNSRPMSMEYVEVGASSKAPSQQWSSTLERRQQNLSDVERRKQEAERRKNEAKMRSLDRQKAFDAADMSETGF